MGETARERFHRMQEEQARKASEQAPVPEARRADAPRSLAAALELASRKADLLKRLRALGAPVTADEIPNDGAELADLERFCGEQEQAAQ